MGGARLVVTLASKSQMALSSTTHRRLIITSIHGISSPISDPDTVYIFTSHEPVLTTMLRVIR